MGIRHLETFIRNRKEVPEGTFTVDILKQIEKFRLENPDKKPLIVIDQLGFMALWQPKEEILCGFRSKQYCERVRKFFTKFKEAGAELVFFEDGPVQGDKEVTWFQRRDKEYQDQLAIIDEVIKKTPLPLIVYNKHNQIKTAMMVNPLFRKVVAELGECHTVMDAECDLALAAFATERKALAIFANDTDFLIYPGQWRYWSIKDLDDVRMTTTEYNRNALIDTLGLTMEQLPVFATLGGNDIVKYEDVQGFHYYLGQRDKFHNISNYIRSFPLNYNDDDVEKLAKNVFAHRGCTQQYVAAIKASLASYSYEMLEETRKKNQETDPLLSRLAKEDVHMHYGILKGNSFSITILYDDMRVYKAKSKAVPYCQLALDVNRRMMGMYLQHKKDENILRVIYIKESHERVFSRIEVTGIYPEVTVPDLEALIFREENDGLDSIRYELYTWMFKNAFNPIELFKLDNNFIPLLATLAYLIQETDFTIDDADIFVSSYYDCTVDHLPKTESLPIHLNLRAFKQSFLFLKMYHHAFRALRAVGLKNHTVQTVFDGIHYHQVHEKWSKMDEDTKRQRLDEIKEYRAIYCKV